MGTVFEIKTAVTSKITRKKFSAVCQKSFDEISRLENQMSHYNPNSLLSKVNKNAGVKPVKITNAIIDVIDTALDVSKQSAGAFDITFGPLGKLWNIKHRKKPPTIEEIKKAKNLVDYKKVILDKKNETLFLAQKNMSIGLGGIAKGYAAKKAADILIENGFENFIINAGGDLYFNGRKNNTLWTSAIKEPNGIANPILNFKIKTDCAVVTSGDYERFFVYEGKKYHHIINPHTGYPARGIKSVSVFATDPTLADAWATAFFILGYERSLKIIKSRPDIAFIMIDDKNQTLKSRNLDKFIEII